QAALGRPAEALDLARRGLDLDDGALPALTANLTRTEVMCLAALDRLAEAEEAARRYLVREPLFADLHFYLGQVRLRQGDGPDAERSLNAFLKVLHQMENDPAILSRFGFAATIGEAGRAAQDVARLMFARQDFKGGATVLARAVTLCPDDAGLRASWAQALAAAGDKATARRQAEAVLELDPANEAARRVIEQLARTGPDF
ncbi:MAG: hypothetical protein KJ621_00515, partial [Proteobacteria bacterium]|nr:hypothetical protein [Pseudomonadota bacterium]